MFQSQVSSFLNQGAELASEGVINQDQSCELASGAPLS